MRNCDRWLCCSASSPLVEEEWKAHWLCSRTTLAEGSDWSHLALYRRARMSFASTMKKSDYPQRTRFDHYRQRLLPNNCTFQLNRHYRNEMPEQHLVLP